MSDVIRTDSLFREIARIAERRACTVRTMPSDPASDLADALDCLASIAGMARAAAMVLPNDEAERPRQIERVAA